MQARTENDVLLIGVAGLALWYFFLDPARAGRQAGSAAANIVTGAVTGAGAAVNAGVINPIVQAVTGDPNATAGGVVFDSLHFTTPTADMLLALPNAYRADYGANIYDAAGNLIGYETDDYWIRDAGGNRIWQSSFTGSGWGMFFHFPVWPY